MSLELSPVLIAIVVVGTFAVLCVVVWLVLQLVKLVKHVQKVAVTYSCGVNLVLRRLCRVEAAKSMANSLRSLSPNGSKKGRCLR